MTKEEQQKDDIETMKILFNADINELCNQRRFNNAREMEGIRDRIIQALEQQPSDSNISDPCDGCRYELNSTNGNPCYSCGKYKLTEQQPSLKDRLEKEYLVESLKEDLQKLYAENEELHKKLEQQPKRCDSCTHSEERDGSNCYECIKGMSDNFEAQPKTSYISIDATKFAKEVAEKVLDEITYEGKTIREWAEILVNQQPCEDAISRSELLRHQHIIYDDDGEGYRAVYVKDIKAMPSVTPTSEDIKEAYLKGYDYGVKDWFKSKTQPTEAVSREAVEEITFQEPSYTDPYNILTEVREKVRALPSVTPERPKGKWRRVVDKAGHWVWECDCKWQQRFATNFCPDCGADMRGEEDEDND